MRDIRTATALLCLCFACDMPTANNHPDVHGHRGCRGLMPENTVAGFQHALELGCDWLELDVVVNADGQLVVSHEPWMSATICLDRNGRAFSADQERLLNIFHMTTADLALFDCGSKPHTGFPGQSHAFATKPLLSQVVTECDEHAGDEMGQPPRYNIEIKSDPALYGEFQPLPGDFASIVMRTIDSLGIGERCIIQSFDPAVLEAAHAIDANLRIALLVDNTDGVEKNLRRLSFPPAIYSPEQHLLDQPSMDLLRARELEVLAWTVNDSADMRRIIALDVDGIITDFPDRLMALLDAQ